ncbi:ribosome maturation factor RimM [Tumebacillus sp. ITR2]|uniref:Ribosome maturation factor RimM n=1 Tax=Tumebacillus amylolyticus TaxID=2801339 RepID=A0ABS1JF01_9BACL|nr:ribosome maturation factor RimM [Tumebacillus amylolyticus]MBL0388869.1 ribosome maturation factor RimM [Tumebacillus amylolyticus]
MKKEQLILVGHLVNTQGVRGEVRVVSRTDFDDVRFKSGSTVLLVHPNFQKPIELKISSSRPHKQFILLTFEGHFNINDVEKYKGGDLMVREQDLVELPENTYYIYQLIGCQVVTDEGEVLGVLKDVLQPGANDVYVVKPPKGKDILLPVIPSCVLDVDVENKKVLVHILPGLLD